MKTILCFGDSLTWGYNAEGPSRHAYEDRWPSVLQHRLGQEARIIAEGLNGRTTAYDDWLSGADRNGARILPTLLMSHSPLDLIIIMLGTNDMKPFICGRAIGAKQGIQRLIDIVRGHKYPLDEPPPGILVVAPPPFCQTENTDFAAQFDGGISESRKLAVHYADAAEQAGCGFFDAGTVARTTLLDGVHLDAENTRAVGMGLEPIVRRILGL